MTLVKVNINELMRYKMKHEVTIEDILGSAILSLNDMPNLQEAVIKNKYFITMIEREAENVWVPEREYITLIDFQNTNYPKSMDEYNKQSLDLYNKFKGIKHFYKC